LNKELVVVAHHCIPHTFTVNHHIFNQETQSHKSSKILPPEDCASDNHCAAVNIKIIPNESAAATKTGTIASLINSTGDNFVSQNHSFDFQKKNNNQYIGENIA